MSGYIGTQPVPQATQTRSTFTATAGQTSFATGGYTPNFLDVYLNGVHLQDGVDYTASNGSDVVLAVGAAIDDVLEVISYSTFEIVNSGGYYKGSRGTVGTAASAGDIFRVNDQTLNSNVTIDSDQNASCAGPLTLATGVILTVNGNLTVV